MAVRSAAIEDAKLRPLDLRIAPDGWGDSELADVEAVLRSAGDALTRHYADHDIPAINVQPAGGPIVLFRRADDGAVVMKLDTGDRRWAQLAFQFAHELCHVMSRFDEDIHGHDWFEETLCEVASLYVLRSMGKRWRTDAPYDNWRHYAPHLTRYAQDRIDEAPLPEGKTLAEWYAEHAKVLSRMATDRDLNRVAAGALLPLLEQEPEHWEAVRWLNEATPGRVQSLGEFLGDWRRHAPQRHAAFIDKIAAALGVAIEPPAADEEEPSS